MNIELLKNKKVLYVEDDIAIVKTFSRILNKVFKEVIVGMDGVEGLVSFKNNQDIDFIITDINMPNMDGLEMIEEIRKLGSEIPVILTTAHGEYDYFLRADTVNVYRYIQKPININEFLELLINYKKEN
jgi:DNA-binding NtrC family response regulator